MRAALYARYSTDKQRETSIDDQLRGSRERAAREGWSVVATHTDEGISGSTPVALRRGGKALLADALVGRWDILIVEGLDRLSREIGEAEQLVKRLEHRGIRIIGTADGYDSEARGRKVMRIARGLINELYLDDLREKTHRGLAGQFVRGFAVTGRSYGYRSVEADGGHRLMIDEAEAVHVRWIFERFADGASARSIAHELNARKVPSPRGGTWAVSALFGKSAKGIGLLNNEIYIGRVIWNRRQWLKDPDTGKRRYVDRPREEWLVRQDESLRIVPAELWQRARTRERRCPARGARHGRGKTPTTLLSGVLRCHACGGPVVGINRQRYGCSQHKDRGDAVCPNDVSVVRDVVETRLLAELRQQLLEPSTLAQLHAEVRALVSEQLRASAGDAEASRRRLQVVQAEIARLVEAVASLGISEALRARLRAAEAERAELEACLARERKPQNVTVDDIAARYRRMVLQLRQVLAGEQDRSRTRQILADLLGPVTLGRDEKTGEVFAELEEPAERLLLSAAGESLGVVAGARFELATFGL